jgi:hypothetical protein
MKDKNKGKNLIIKIKLRSGATSLFDVQRWTFYVGRSFFNMFNVYISKQSQAYGASPPIEILE